MVASLPPFPEAAGEVAYVRVRSMGVARLLGKVADADHQAAVGAGGPAVFDLAFPDQAANVAGVVAGDLGSDGEGDNAVSSGLLGLLHQVGCPFQDACGGLEAEGAELL